MTATLSSNNVVLLGVVPGDAVSLNTNGYVANFASAGAVSYTHLDVYKRQAI